MNKHEVLIRDILSVIEECEWVEFKANFHHKEVGEYISALSNSSALAGQPKGYLIYGIEDTTKRVIGTNFNPASFKVGNEILENWLINRLMPKCYFKFTAVIYEGKGLVLLEVDAASESPITFDRQAFVRVGSAKRLLNDFPAVAKKLWLTVDKDFEMQIAKGDLSLEEVMDYLNFDEYLKACGLHSTSPRDVIVDKLLSDGLLIYNNDLFDLPNWAAIMFSRNISEFGLLSRKMPRVIMYKGSTKVDTRLEITGKLGYALGFKGLMDFIQKQLPMEEIVQKGIRSSTTDYPEIAIREIVANALVHQDFRVPSTGPLNRNIYKPN